MEHLKKSIELVKSQNQRGSATKVVVKTPIVNQSLYFLNKSKSKFVSVGLSPTLSQFEPVVQINGVKNQCATFDKIEWGLLLENQGIIENYFREGDCQWQPLNVGSKTIHFLTIERKKIIKIENFESEVWLAWETLAELWDLLPLIKHRLEILSNEGFKEFYFMMINGIVDLPGDYKINIMNILQQLTNNANASNVSCMMEVLHFLSDRIIADLSLAVNCQG
jgi:hypothetical protein